MKNEFKYTKTTVSLINYHFVFCPRYRRKIFNIPGVETAFKTMVMDICKENNIDIPGIMHLIKGVTSNKLRALFPELKKMPSLWTRSYFVSTAGNVSSETIKWYVDTQKTRY